MTGHPCKSFSNHAEERKEIWNLNKTQCTLQQTCEF